MSAVDIGFFALCTMVYWLIVMCPTCEHCGDLDRLFLTSSLTGKQYWCGRCRKFTDGRGPKHVP